MNKKLDKFIASETFFSCPICKQSMHISEHSIFCACNHCFNIASKGYINFITSKQNTKYSADLFESRKLLFEEGFYSPVVERIQNIIDTHTPKPRTLLDAGCGEGYYAAALSPSCNVFALDSSKQAIAIACRNTADVKWMVADLSNLPFKKHSIDVVLNILSPASYEQFSSILSSDGIIIKAVPGEHYLSEIRTAVSGQLKNKAYSNGQVVSHFKQHLNLLAIHEIKYTLPLSPAQLYCFLHMTPLTFNIDTSAISTQAISHITIHLMILVGKALE